MPTRIPITSTPAGPEPRQAARGVAVVPVAGDEQEAHGSKDGRQLLTPLSASLPWRRVWSAACRRRWHPRSERRACRKRMANFLTGLRLATEDSSTGSAQLLAEQDEAAAQERRAAGRFGALHRPPGQGPCHIAGDVAHACGALCPASQRSGLRAQREGLAGQRRALFAADGHQQDPRRFRRRGQGCEGAECDTISW